MWPTWIPPIIPEAASYLSETRGSGASGFHVGAGRSLRHSTAATRARDPAALSRRSASERRDGRARSDFRHAPKGLRASVSLDRCTRALDRNTFFLQAAGRSSQPGYDAHKVTWLRKRRDFRRLFPPSRYAIGNLRQEPKLTKLPARICSSGVVVAGGGETVYEIRDS